MQVGLRSAACQFVVPLVPSQEALRQASSHAKIGTDPTNTHTHTHTFTVTPLWLQALQYHGFICVFMYVWELPLFSIFIDHKRQMLKGRCERHCGPLHKWRMEHRLPQYQGSRAHISHTT